MPRRRAAALTPGFLPSPPRQAIREVAVESARAEDDPDLVPARAVGVDDARAPGVGHVKGESRSLVHCVATCGATLGLTIACECASSCR
jgi:hypothetical protein